MDYTSRLSGSGLAPTTGFVSRNKKVIIIVLVGLFLFYWFQLRPGRISRACMSTATVNAKDLLSKKAITTAEADKRKTYQQLSDQGMYLRSDWESFYKKCMRTYGWAL